MTEPKPKKQPPPPALELRDVPVKGRGVFAVRDFAKGEEVLQFVGDTKDVKEFADLTYALQIGPTTYLGPSGRIDDYVNHSCDPNTGVRDPDGRVVLFALEAIAKGDEITFDYSTTQAGQHWPISCACGSANCRGTIGDFADLPQERQRYFRDRGALLDYLK